MDDLLGIYPAIVCDVKDPEKRGRVRVSCPDVFGDVETSSAWCDPCVPIGIEDGGDICIPDIDEGVWIMFNGGDVDEPVYIGGWWSEGRTPFGEDYPETPNEVRIINFEDTTITMQEGSCVIDAVDNVIILEDGICQINSKDNTITLKEGYCTVSSGGVTISITDGKVTINGDVNITGKLTVSGDASIKGKSFISHTHMGVHGGTSAPQ